MDKQKYPPQKRLSFNLVTLVRVFVLAAFLVTAVQSSVLAGPQYALRINNSTGYPIKFLSVVWNGNSTADFASIPNGYYVTISSYAPINIFSAVVTFKNGTTRSYGPVQITGATVTLR